VRRRHHSWGPEGHFFVISRRDGRVERGVSRSESATLKNRALENISSDYYSLINSLLCIFDSFFYDISTGRPGVATIDGTTVTHGVAKRFTAAGKTTASCASMM